MVSLLEHMSVFIWNYADIRMSHCRGLFLLTSLSSEEFQDVLGLTADFLKFDHSWPRYSWVRPSRWSKVPLFMKVLVYITMLLLAQCSDLICTQVLLEGKLSSFHANWSRDSLVWIIACIGVYSLDKTHRSTTSTSFITVQTWRCRNLSYVDLEQLWVSKDALNWALLLVKKVIKHDQRVLSSFVTKRYTLSSQSPGRNYKRVQKVT